MDFIHFGTLLPREPLKMVWISSYFRRYLAMPRQAQRLTNMDMFLRITSVQVWRRCDPQNESRPIRKIMRIGRYFLHISCWHLKKRNLLPQNRLFQCKQAVVSAMLVIGVKIGVNVKIYIFQNKRKTSQIAYLRGF